MLDDEVFSAADKMCKNVSRLWYGTRNIGGIITTTPINFNKFIELFPPKTPKAQRNIKVNNEYLEDDSAEKYLMTDSFTWESYLSGVCDLWDRRMQGEYDTPKRLPD